MKRPRFLPDDFTLALIATVSTASWFPASGRIATDFNVLTNLAIGLLFFMHGAKLPRETLLAGARHWRLHLTVLVCTFVLFPALGFILKPLLAPLMTPNLYTGMLFLCMLPSTVQSSIAFTSVAHGNVAAAICSATASNLLGIFLTPALVALLLVTGSGSTSSLDAILSIAMQLLLPFIAGQIARRWIGLWMERRAAALKYVDQGSILLVVYTAFSEAVNQGLWQQLPLRSLAGLLLGCGIMLAAILLLTKLMARKLRFNTADEIAIVFCGSKKSLASGVPMAKVLFASHTVGAIVLPLMLFHQIQLMACAVLAQRYAKRAGGK